MITATAILDLEKQINNETVTHNLVQVSKLMALTTTLQLMKPNKTYRKLY